MEIPKKLISYLNEKKVPYEIFTIQRPLPHKQ